MSTHATYDHENPVPECCTWQQGAKHQGLFKPTLAECTKGKPVVNNTITAQGHSKTKRIQALMESTLSARLKKFQWMKGEGAISTTKIANRLGTTNSNIHLQLKRLIETKHVVRMLRNGRAEYTWIGEK